LGVSRPPRPERTLPIGLVRSAISFALRQGWEVNAILARAGISAELLAQGRARVTEAQGTEMMRALWELTDDEMLGMGSHPLPRGSFKLLCYGLIGAEDLRDALNRARGFARAMPALPRPTITEEDGLARLSWEGLAFENDSEHLLTYSGIALVHRLIAWALAQPMPLTRVELPFPEPASTEMADLVFGAPQVYAAPHPAIVFDAVLLQAPLLRSEAELDEFIANSPAGLLARPTQARRTSSAVRKLVQQGLARGQRLEAAEIAKALTMSQQTLRRRLAEEGTSLREIRDEQLRDAAITALVGDRESVAEIATRLGFSETSAFTRAFRRWTGSPPSAYRVGQ